MKQIISINMLILSIIFLNGCSHSSPVAPSQNSALNSISNSNGNKKAGYMQKSMDRWLKNDWTPTVSKNKEIQKKYMKKEKTSDGKVKYIERKDRAFKLQEYVDKATAYRKAHPNDYNNSNVRKLESMPVIGK